MRDHEEEKKSDDMSHTEPEPQTKATAATAATDNKTPPSSTLLGEVVATTPTSTSSVEASKIGPVGHGMRFFLLDLPLLVLLSIYAAVQLAEYAKEELFASQYEGLLWGSARQAEEITYYTRICDTNDISTSDPREMFLPANGTGAQGADIMMKHGFTVVPGVVKPENAARLRAYIDSYSKNLTPEEAIWLVKGKNRYSFNLGTEAPGMNEVLEDLANHKQLTDTMEAILGPDPAMIEMNVITAAYGAEDQWYHDDAVPDGSPSRYAHAFSPALSLFVTLQDLTNDMGITSACPGTHYCAGGDLTKACNEKGFQLADENGELKSGDTFLFNMNVWHRGAAHKDPNGHDRVMLILSFVPKPKSEAESRQMVHGITYAMRWDMWGFTWNDMKRASTDMVRPWNYLRALGLYKPKDASWGLDFITSASMRAANGNNGFGSDDVKNAVIFEELLPQYFQLTDDEVADLAGVTNGWFWYCNDQIALLLKIFKKFTVTGFVGYISIFTVLGLVSRQSLAPTVFGSVRRLALICAVVGGMMLLCRRSIDSTQWAKDLKARRRFFGVMGNQEFFDEVKDGLHALPNREDVLIENRYGYKDLHSYNDAIDYHYGNQRFRKYVDAVAPSYATYPDALKVASVEYITESIIAESGRFLEQGMKGRWHLMDMETSTYFVKKVLASKTKGLFGMILKETRHLKSVMRYGIYRNTDIAILSAPFLGDLTTKFLNACIGEKPTASTSGFVRPPIMKPKYTEDGTTVLRWKQPVVDVRKPLLNASRKVLSAPESPAKTVARKPRRKYVPKEPHKGAWIVQGDMVEAKIGKNWYVGKIMEISAHGNHKIDFLDGDSGFYDEYQIRRPVPWARDQNVEVLVGKEDDVEIFDSAVIVDVETNGDITLQSIKTKEYSTVNPSKLRRKVTTALPAKPGHSYAY